MKKEISNILINSLADYLHFGLSYDVLKDFYIKNGQN